MVQAEHNLGHFLRDRRARLDPGAYGFGNHRRRTPGLRREEVAQRAHMSATWYTWLEQGRGGAPSADMLNRISKALMLTDAERDHMFLLALGRPADPQYRPIDGVEPRLQRVLDAMASSPALIKTATWDIVAWNRAACIVFTDYALIAPEDRNLLRLIFASQNPQNTMDGWRDMARFVVAAFRADVVRAGANNHIQTMVEDLSARSTDFAQLWHSNDVIGAHGSFKRLHHAKLGLIELEGSIFAVDGRPELSLVVHNPVDPSVAETIAKMITSY